MRLIDADALRDALGITGEKYSCSGCKYDGRYGCNIATAPSFDYVCDQIDDAPTVEAVPLRHAKLINPHPYGECSICGTLIDIRDEFNYCPHCGAKLDLKED